MHKRLKYPRPNVIAVDVDGTLLVNGKANTRLIDWCREQHALGMTLMLWSSQGQAHAQAVADQFGITDIFDAIISKPGYIVDDKGWSWIKYTKIIKNLRVLLD